MVNTIFFLEKVFHLTVSLLHSTLNSGPATWFNGVSICSQRSGLFRDHKSPGTKSRNATSDTYFPIWLSSNDQWNILSLLSNNSKPFLSTDNIFVARVCMFSLKTPDLLRSGFSLGDLRYASRRSIIDHDWRLLPALSFTDVLDPGDTRRNNDVIIASKTT